MPTAQQGNQLASSNVRPDGNGQHVRLPGFIVPIEHSGTGVRAIVFAPNQRAYVHVAPPPAIQLAFVTT
ncbi:MAG: DUF3299 domain-containing protein [Paracoccaceae bacterium]